MDRSPASASIPLASSAIPFGFSISLIKKYQAKPSGLAWHIQPP